MPGRWVATANLFYLPVARVPGVEGVAVLRRGRRGSAAGRDRAGAGRRATGRGVAKAWRRASLADGHCRPAASGCRGAGPVGPGGRLVPKGSIRRRPSGARTPPSASPSTPHLGAECGRGRPRTNRCQCLWGFGVSRWDAARGGHLAPLDAAPALSNVAPFPLLFAADVVRANPLLLLGFPDWDKFALGGGWGKSRTLVRDLRRYGSANSAAASLRVAHISMANANSSTPVPTSSANDSRRTTI